MTTIYRRVGEREATIKTNARSSALKSAKRGGGRFDLPPAAELPDIPKSCPLCCKRMKAGGPNRNNSPSLDRILPRLGYIIENVWWICHDCNRQKSDLDPARAYELWDLVWDEIEKRGLPLPATRLRPEKTDD